MSEASRLGITLQETRGSISYICGDEVTTRDLWVMLPVSGNNVVARKVYGRNRWQLCDVDVVCSFVPFVKECKPCGHSVNICKAGNCFCERLGA